MFIVVCFPVTLEAQNFDSSLTLSTPKEGSQDFTRAYLLWLKIIYFFGSQFSTLNFDFYIKYFFHIHYHNLLLSFGQVIKILNAECKIPLNVSYPSNLFSQEMHLINFLLIHVSRETHISTKCTYQSNAHYKSNENITKKLCFRNLKFVGTASCRFRRQLWHLRIRSWV